MNFCKDCAHFVDLYPRDKRIGKRCSHPSLQTESSPDPVTGSVDDDTLMVASLARLHDRLCGRQGKRFEPKPAPEPPKGLAVRRRALAWWWAQ